jgi:PAS domain S-box-containing protein
MSFFAVRLLVNLSRHKDMHMDVVENGAQGFESMPATREFLLKIIEASYDGILIADMNDVCLHANSAMERITGYGRDFFIGKRFSDYFEVENWADELSEEKVARVNETGRIAYEARLQRSDGRIVYLEHGVSLVQDNEGTCIATVWIVRDITEKKMDSLALKQADEYRNRFFANLTHEFRSPLTLCIGPLENLLHGDFGVLEQPVRQQLETVLRSSQTLLMMVNQLLDFSMLHSGTLKIACARIQVCSMLNVLIASYKDLCSQKNIRIECRVPDGLPPLFTDPIHLRSILYNIMACVFAAEPVGSPLTIEVENLPVCEPGEAAVALTEPARAGSQRVSIQTGSTVLSDDQCQHLCDGLEAVATGPDALSFGIAIRLMHARDLAAALEGSLIAESVAEEGNRFVLTLPQAGVDALPDTGASDDVSPGDTGIAVPVCAPEIAEDSGQNSGARPLVMIVEDNLMLRNYIATIVQRAYDTVSVGNGLEALKKMQACAPDLILSDSMLPGLDGYELLRTVKASKELRAIPFVFLTARDAVEMKIAGLEEGADDYIVKPFNAQELMARIKSLLRMRELMMKNAAQASQISSMRLRLQEKYRYGAIIGKSAPMRRMYQLLDSIRDSEATVLITGETGTGKELVANAIHFNSRRSARPLVSVNCGAIPRELMEREFFGHVKGAYTGAVETRRGYFAEASGGTLFLDEIGEMDRDMQVKLLRVLERGEISRVGDPLPRKVDVRLVAATNKDLRAEIRAGRFREDLFYRIFVIPIHVPPLRERIEDIPLLIDHFCEKLRKKMNIDTPPIPEADYQMLVQHNYPGNVRELENLVERSCLLGGVSQDSPADGNGIGAAPEPAGICTPAAGYDELLAHPEPLKRVQHRAARDLIMHTLRLCDNNHAEAAKRLGIARSSLYRKINEFESGN